MVDINTGQICNNCCIMCTTIRTEDKKAVQKMVPLSDVYSQIERTDGDGCVSITGGEPTIRKDLPEIIRRVKERSPDVMVRLLTNGRMLSIKPFCQALKAARLDGLVIPIHAHAASLHDFIARAKGSFDQTVKGIRNAADAGLMTEIRVVIHGINYPFIPETAVFIRNNFPTCPVVFLYFDIIGSAYLNRERLVVPMTRTVPYLDRAASELNMDMTRIYHFPLCILPSSLWRIAKGKTVPDRRIGFTDRCQSCKEKDECPGIWKTYLKIKGDEEFSPIP